MKTKPRKTPKHRTRIQYSTPRVALATDLENFFQIAARILNQPAP